MDSSGISYRSPGSRTKRRSQSLLKYKAVPNTYVYSSRLFIYYKIFMRNIFRDFLQVSFQASSKYNNTHRGNFCLTQSSTISRSSANSEFFHMFTQLIKFYTLHCHIYRIQMFEQGDSSNKQQMNGYSFQQLLKQHLSWILKRFLFEVSFQSQQENHIFFYHMVLGIFKIAHHLIDRHVFM